ncbi:hypothetical protein EO92_00760 [Methanosarcina sp. 2.H.A.1B.4]|nr:hypothetical protein EO92_00760 [Methanosarcina sp. 2.H.A.1B.4]
MANEPVWESQNGKAKTEPPKQNSQNGKAKTEKPKQKSQMNKAFKNIHSILKYLLALVEFLSVYVAYVIFLLV